MPPQPVTIRYRVRNYENADEAWQSAKLLFDKGNLAAADMLCRRAIELAPENGAAYALLGTVARDVGALEKAVSYYERALALGADAPSTARDLEAVRARRATRTQHGHVIGEKTKYLVIKSWGHGFWSDVANVLGNLLLCEMTGRVPVVDWGDGCRYSDRPDVDGFGKFFERPSPTSLDDVLRKTKRPYFPAKWTAETIRKGDVNRLTGPGSRMAGIYLLNRAEQVAVSDFYISVAELLPWLPASHPYSGMGADAALRALIRRNLRPRRQVIDAVERFRREHLDKPFVAVHLRGTDKIKEFNDLSQATAVMFAVIDDLMSRRPFGLFVMTDDVRLLERANDRYGARVVSTASARAGGDIGLHFAKTADPVRLGEEVMVDTYLALHAEHFVGLAASGPSMFVSLLREWQVGRLHLVGRNTYESPNLFLHLDPAVAPDADPA
ncbi:MAG: hypothetical protein GY791_08275 [Alphaproteobacteria bacterium]|nr:hypothetical protein [Alphaproteobacteria bacterium]